MPISIIRDGRASFELSLGVGGANKQATEAQMCRGAPCGNRPPENFKKCYFHFLRFCVWLKLSELKRQIERSIQQ